MVRMWIGLAWVAGAGTAALGQGAGCTRVAGVVMDPTGAVISGAAVTVDAKVRAVSGADGRFVFACVGGGGHTVVAVREGFGAGTVAVTAPRATDVVFRLVPAAETTVDVDADDAGAGPPPGGSNGILISGKRLQSLADDPDDLLRQLQQLAAAAGGSPSRTVISVDGFQDAARLPPKDSIAFINVSPDLFSAEYREPPFGGGRVEVYTKPGAKTYHGALFATNSSGWMNARDAFSVSAGTTGKQRYGFDFSGPIRKTGSNFSLSLEHRGIDEVAVVNALTFDVGGNVVRTLDSVAQPQRLWVGQARVDWQLGKKDFAFVTYSADVETKGGLGVGGGTLREAGYADGTGDHTVRVSNITTFTPKVMHEARASWEWYHETDLPVSTAPSVSVSGYFAGGGAGIGNTRQFRTGLEYDDDVVMTLARHTIKTGFQLFYKTRNSDLLNGFNGSYIFSSAAQYKALTPAQFSNVSGLPNVRLQQVRFAAFFQDDVKLTSQVNLSVGMRYFLETDPGTFTNFDPRVGLAWSPDKKKTWQVKTHFGVFNGQFSADEAQELHREDGVQRITSLIYKPTYGTQMPGGAAVHSQRRLGAGFTPGDYVIGDASVSKDLPGGFNVNVQSVFIRFLSYVRTVNINQPLDNNPYGVRPLGPNLNILEVQGNGTGQGNGEFVGVSNFKMKRVQFFVGGLHINIRDNTNDGIFFQPQSAYTDSGEEVRRDNQGLYQVFGNVSFNLPYKLALTGDGYAEGGQPFNLTTGADDNGDGAFNDRPQYAAMGAVADGKTVFATPFGVLTNAGAIVKGVPLRPIERDLGKLPWSFHLDANLQRAFVVTRNAKADQQQTVTVNVRSANFLNHTNVTAEGSVLGSPQFLVPVAADTARRLEVGLRYSF